MKLTVKSDDSSYTNKSRRSSSSQTASAAAKTSCASAIEIGKRSSTSPKRYEIGTGQTAEVPTYQKVVATIRTPTRVEKRIERIVYKIIANQRAGTAQSRCVVPALWPFLPYYYNHTLPFTQKVQLSTPYQKT